MADNTSDQPDAGRPRQTVQQPKPQALPVKSGPASILVSTRQKGNPVLNSIKGLAWEYSDIVPDYVLGATTCALFLQLKYHRLHPEYIYSRIQAIKGKYNLRVLLTLVDIVDHETSLKELSKTSLVNNLTLILCWSAQEAARYLELFKSFEHAQPTSIRAHQSTSYADKLVEFITVPRSINKTDAIGLVSSFGSVRTAVNARPEEVALVDGWGEKKVKRWCSTVRENFRVQKAAKRGVSSGTSRATASKTDSQSGIEKDSALAARLGIATSVDLEANSKHTSSTLQMADENMTDAQDEIDEDAELAMREASGEVVAEEQISRPPAQPKRKQDGELSEGVSAALERLRRGG